MHTALNLRDCIKMPSIRDIKYKRQVIYASEIQQKIITKPMVGKSCFLLFLDSRASARANDGRRDKVWDVKDAKDHNQTEVL